MNKNDCIKLINQYVIARNAIANEDQFVDNVTTNLQHTKLSDIVFYKIKPNDEKSLNNFKNRLVGNNPGLIVLNHGTEFIKNENTIFVDEEHFLKIQKILLDEMFPNKNKLKLIGVTGTNGKTTTVNLAMQISSLSGHPAFSIGTIGVQDMNGAIADDLESTTPSYVELRKLIYRFQDKYQACFMEVSSHALIQDRLFDLKLDAAAWTSFSQDHLDYHRTMEEYFKAKLLIEKKYLVDQKSLVVPADEVEMREQILKESPNSKIKIAKTLKERGFGESLAERPLFYHSTYNQSNSELALELVGEVFGDECLQTIKLKDIKTPLGRFSIIELSNNNLAIVDYAHTPDALVNIGRAIKITFPEHSLTVVFGCGGNRDKTKRPLMGKVVSEFADKMIVTSDNPRDEAPEDIIIDIIAGVKGSYEAVVDRKKAIIAALSEMKKKEIVLIAGKGHEEYQEIKGIKHPFSDFNIVLNFKDGK